jgi:hypothetical protein
MEWTRRKRGNQMKVLSGSMLQEIYLQDTSRSKVSQREYQRTLFCR